jgi:hypothetical protein
MHHSEESIQFAPDREEADKYGYPAIMWFRSSARVEEGVCNWIEKSGNGNLINLMIQDLDPNDGHSGTVLGLAPLPGRKFVTGVVENNHNGSIISFKPDREQGFAETLHFRSTVQTTAGVHEWATRAEKEFGSRRVALVIESFNPASSPSGKVVGVANP